MPDRDHTQSARAVFSDAARARLQCDAPITAVDAATGVTLTFRPAEDTLTLSGGCLGDHVQVVPCAEQDLDATARALLDRLLRPSP